MFSKLQSGFVKHAYSRDHEYHSRDHLHSLEQNKKSCYTFEKIETIDLPVTSYLAKPPSGNDKN